MGYLIYLYLHHEHLPGTLLHVVLARTEIRLYYSRSDTAVSLGSRPERPLLLSVYPPCSAQV